MTVGPALRVRAKVTVVEDPQAALPDYILHSTLCHAFTKTHWSPHHPPSLCLLSSSLVFKSRLLSLFNAGLFLSHLSSPVVYLSVVRSALWNLDLDFTTTTAHLSLSSLLLLSSLPCFALSPPGRLLHQPRQELILEFCPWFPPLSPWAVTCQRCPPLGAPSCCNYLWHPGSGASTQVTWWRGWVQRVERRKGRFFLCSRQGDVSSAADLPATAGVRIKLYSLPCTPIKKGHFINP